MPIFMFSQKNIQQVLQVNLHALFTVFLRFNSSRCVPSVNKTVLEA